MNQIMTEAFFVIGRFFYETSNPVILSSKNTYDLQHCNNLDEYFKLLKMKHILEFIDIFI
jgi:hypothetical protein